MRLFGVPKSRQRIEDNMPAAGLTFSVANDYPDTVVYADNAAFRAIGGKGRNTLYSIIAPSLSSSDVRLLCQMKQELATAAFTFHDKTPKEQIAAARTLALGLLSGRKTDERKDLLAYMLAHEVCGQGAISILLDDSKNIEEIVVNSPAARIGIYHTEHGYCATNLRFTSERAFRYTINRLISATERELNSNVPIIDAQLDNGSRLHAQLKPYAATGAAATIRLTPSKRLDIRRLMESGAATPELLAYLWLAMESRMNIVISGPPASGKTSMLIALSALMPRYDRIITIEEDVNELGRYNNFYNMVPLQGSSILGRASTRDQVINALHMRPERIIVGEIRGREAAELMVAANLGIPFMTTMHSSADGQAILDRLGSKPMDVPQETLSNLDVSIFLSHHGPKRAVASVSEYIWLQRAEASPDEVSGDRLVRISKMAADGRMDSNALDGSKALKAYSGLFMASHASTVKEFKARTAFLKRMLAEDNSATDSADYISQYVSFDGKNRTA
ncbi:MAG: type II/IV secretion system ATPase subunit [Candidatus Micrarchaeota archaeon]|nr:type II/IV secretion system ATPase subunit [Candidatus Micrarchaeota archaeon]